MALKLKARFSLRPFTEKRRKKKISKLKSKMATKKIKYKKQGKVAEKERGGGGQLPTPPPKKQRSIKFLQDQSTRRLSQPKPPRSLADSRPPRPPRERISRPPRERMTPLQRYALQSSTPPLQPPPPATKSWTSPPVLPPARGLQPKEKQLDKDFLTKLPEDVIIVLMSQTGTLEDLKKYCSLTTGFSELCKVNTQLKDHKAYLEIMEASKMTNKNIRKKVKSWIESQNTMMKTHFHIKDWDVSNVTDMSYLFSALTPTRYHRSYDSDEEDIPSEFFSTFNDELGGWDVSNVKDMSFMFEGATSFNQPIGKWNVSNVFNMDNMFRNSTNFNDGMPAGETNEKLMESIGSWDVRKAVSYVPMVNTFLYAESFNQDLSKWDIKDRGIYLFHANMTAAHMPMGEYMREPDSDLSDSDLSDSDSSAN
jgi:surface protein